MAEDELAPIGEEMKESEDDAAIDRRTLLNRLGALGIGLAGLKLLSDADLGRVVGSAEREPDIAAALKEGTTTRVVVSPPSTQTPTPRLAPAPLNDVIISPDTRREDRVPPGQSVTKGFPVTGGPIQHVDPASWTFRISGLVDEERTLSFEEFTAIEHVKVLSDIHCVTTWSKLDNLWEGIPAKAIRDLVSVKPEAKYVLVHAEAGFSANLPIEDFFAEDVVFALKHNNAVLSPDHGYPVRLVVPRLYFWKSAKWANGVEFMAEDKAGYWESLGYHMRGDPWLEERYGVEPVHSLALQEHCG